MAEVQQGGGEQKKGKPKKMSLRVDFTPMVDMNMLLITFFMFCTSLAKPQTMDITMPAKEENLREDEKNKVESDKAITVILGANNRVYYYLGMPNYKDYTSLKEASYGGVDDKNSIRTLLLSRNRVSVEKIRKLRDLKARKQITQDNYDAEVKKIKNAKDGQVVVIKPADESTYANMVDCLDEMQICSIGKYAIVEMTAGDKFLVQNLESKGGLTAQAEQVAKQEASATKQAK